MIPFEVILRFIVLVSFGGTLEGLLKFAVDLQLPFGGLSDAAIVQVDPQLVMAIIADAGIFLRGETIEGARDGADTKLLGHAV